MKKKVLLPLAVLFLAFILPIKAHAADCTTDQVVAIYGYTASNTDLNFHWQTVIDPTVETLFKSKAVDEKCTLTPAALSLLQKGREAATAAHTALLPALVTPVTDLNNPQFAANNPITAVPSPTPCEGQGESTATSVPTQCGGNAQTGGAQACCDSQLSTINPCKKIDPSAQNILCIDILWGKICLSDFMKNIGLGTDLIGTDVQQMDSLIGSCNPGFVRQLQSDPNDGGKSVCVCQPGASDQQIRLDFCNQYITAAQTDHTVGGYRTSDEVKQCANCFSKGGYWSGIGCIRMNSFQDFIENNLFGWGLGIAAFIAIGGITFAGIQMQLSQGNPEKIKKSQELLTSFIIGFILIIFSIFILRLIGVTILHIPGFK